MKIKIQESNAAEIEAALRQVNGAAQCHTYTTAAELIDLAAEAQSALNMLGVPKSKQAGAKYLCVSGSRVAASYASKARSRVATAVTLTRSGAGWWLTSVSRREIGRDGGGATLEIDESQAKCAVDALLGRFVVRGK